MQLHLTESSASLGIHATCEAERVYWMSREKAEVKAPVGIDVHAFHNALEEKFHDFLDAIFMELELGDDRTGSISRRITSSREWRSCSCRMSNRQSGGKGS